MQINMNASMRDPRTLAQKKREIEKNDIYRLDTDKVRSEVEGLIRERRQRNRANETDGAFATRMAERFSYLHKQVPLLFNEALETRDMQACWRKTNALLGALETSRRLGENPIQSAVRAEKTIVFGTADVELPGSMEKLEELMY